jgi:hypothetical protein
MSQTPTPDAVEIQRDLVRSWWTSVLTGQIDEPYPVYGSRVEALLEGDVLTIVGTVPSASDHDAIIAEVERLRRYGIVTANVDVDVVAEAGGEPGLLVQTLVVTYETEAQARFAAAYLESQRCVGLVSIRVLVAASHQNNLDATMQSLLPRLYWDDARTAIEKGHAALVVTIDEARAFQVREILDEQTRSEHTLVLPPESRQR